MTSLRLTFISIILCVCAYSSVILGFAHIVTPAYAEGSLITTPDGHVVGSRLIAQAFASDRYFHPRPSACDYNASAAAGSNLSPTNPKLADRAHSIIVSYPAANSPIPADLVTASGSGLDPDITEAAAYFQADRIAATRHLEVTTVHQLIDRTKRPLMGPCGGPNLINILELNLALDQIIP